VRTRLTIACVLAALSLAAPALERTDLSPEAQKLLPPGNRVTVKLKNGTSFEARMEKETDADITVEVDQGTIRFQQTILRKDLVEVVPMDIAAHWGAGLKRLKTDPDKQLPKEQYDQALALFDEYLSKCKTCPDVKAVEERKAEFAAEVANIGRGFEKLGGEWLPPAQAAVRKFDLLTLRLREIEKRYPGIESPNYVQNPKGKQAYDKMQETRRAVARDLPKTVTGRLPLLLEEKSFDEAVRETMSFIQFWIFRVIESEKAAPDLYLRGEGVFEGMNFAYINQLTKQIFAAYATEVASHPPPAPSAPADENMVAVPGGYYLLGREDSAFGDNDFPMHFVKLEPFLLDRHEVSNKEYRRFIDHVKATGDPSMEHPDAPPLKDHTPEGWKNPGLSGDDQPVVGIDWFDAYAYAKWCGKRLPTEAEWEAAARGLDFRVYPWGAAAPSTLSVNCPEGRAYVAAEIDRQRPPPPPPKKGMLGVGSSAPPPPPPKTVLPETTWTVTRLVPPESGLYTIAATNSLSACGALHMGGNAAEWVQDWYEKDYYAKAPVDNPQGPEKAGLHVFRGGSYMSPSQELASTWRGVPTEDTMKRGLSPSGRPIIGLRCAKSISAP
jgi:formylglycine-generating enzyme